MALISCFGSGTKEAEEAVTPAKVDNVSDDVNEKTVENADNHDAIDKQLETGDDVIEEVSSEHTLVDSEVSGKGDVSDNVTEEASSELPKNKDAEAESPGDAQENDSRDQKDDKVDDVSDEKAVDAEAKDVVDENINGDVTSSNAAENINGDVTSSNAKPKSEKEENVDNETPVGHNGGGKGLRRRIARREYSTDGQEEDEGDGIYGEKSRLDYLDMNLRKIRC